MDLGAIPSQVSGMIGVYESPTVRKHAGSHEAEVMGSWGSNAGKYKASGILLAVNTSKPSLVGVLIAPKLAGSSGGPFGGWMMIDQPDEGCLNNVILTRW